jgi:predicted porin
MNKKLIALAVAAALAPAAAMADSGNVTIYGIAHASVDYVNPGTGPAALNDKAWRVSSNSSRLGFKGNEDLGNGLSAIWQMETGVNLDAGTTSTGFMQRNSFLGLSSKTAGTVLFGKHDTPYKLGTGNLDVFADTMGDYNAIVGNVAGTVAFDSRLGNVAAYISPTFGGFHFAGAAVAANETNNTANPNGRAYSLTGVYDNGPMFGSLSYEQAKDISASSTEVAPAALGTVLASLQKANATKLGLGYKFGGATVGFIAERIKLSPLVGSEATRNALYLNGSYTMGSNVLKAAFGKANDISGTSDTGAKQYVVGVDHNLSKRTVAYALYSKMNNDSAGNYGLGGNGAGGAFSPASAGQDPSVWSLGMKHSF